MGLKNASPPLPDDYLPPLTIMTPTKSENDAVEAVAKPTMSVGEFKIALQALVDDHLSLPSAIELNKLPQAKKMIASAGPLDKKLDGNGNTLMICASRGNSADAMLLLISNGASVSLPAFEGKTPLIHAVMCNAPAAAELLIKNGADVNDVDAAGIAPLHYAAISGNLFMCDLLLSHGADMNQQTTLAKHTALMCAALNSQPAVVDLLARRGASLIAKTKSGHNVMSLVGKIQSQTMRKKLITHGCID